MEEYTRACKAIRRRSQVELDDIKRNILDRAERQLQKLLDDRVWKDISSIGYQALPCIIQSRLDPAISAVWSASPKNCPSLIGGLPLQYLRDANKIDASIDDIVKAYHNFRMIYKAHDASASTRDTANDRERGGSVVGRRPIPEVLQITTRSAKINSVMKNILEAPRDDVFALFATGSEVDHLAEPLILSGIHLYVRPDLQGGFKLTACFSVYVGSGQTKLQRHSDLLEMREKDTKVYVLDIKVAAYGLLVHSWHYRGGGTDYG
jgi:hypothetical protein